MQLFELPVRTASWANPPLEIITMEDRKYEILGTGEGEPWHGDKDACYVLMLVMDCQETEYLISTIDYQPRKIQHGEADEILGERFYQTEGCKDFDIGFKFYLSAKRDRLIPAESIRWDVEGNPYVLKNEMQTFTN